MNKQLNSRAFTMIFVFLNVFYKRLPVPRPSNGIAHWTLKTTAAGVEHGFHV